MLARRQALRPVLLLLSGQAFGRVTRKHRVLAAVIEMIHTATFVHDDVLDEAETRRHLATVNSRWDSKTSILLGDFLFTHAFYLGSSIGSSQACRIVGKATNRVCEGELRQKGARGDYSLTEEQYLDIIAAKTAELCACSAQLGAKFAGATEDGARCMAAYGRAVGIAFQIVDDVLDLQGDERTVGKSLGTDLEQQKATLPVIHVLRSATPADRDHVLSILRGEGPSRADALAVWLQRYDAFGYSYEVARRYARDAIRQLEGLRPSLARQHVGGAQRIRGFPQPVNQSAAIKMSEDLIARPRPSSSSTPERTRTNEGAG